MGTGAPLLILSLIFGSLPVFTRGIEHSGYAEPCGDIVRCNPKKDLQCGPVGTCACTLGYVYVSAYEGCLPEPLETNHWACVMDSQCHTSELGKFSYCDQKRCACLREAVHGDLLKDVVRQGNYCYLVNDYGEPCGRDVECDPSSKLRCMPGPGAGRCGCNETTHWAYLDPSTTRKACWDFTVPFPCQSLEECEVIGGLAVCDAREKRCKCSDTFAGNQSTGMYHGKCYFVRGSGEPCSLDGECKVGSEDSSRATCDEVTKTCKHQLPSSTAISIHFKHFLGFVLFTTVCCLHALQF